MTAEQCGTLLDLHRVAMVAQEDALRDGKKWPTAHAADDAFRSAILGMVTP